jgi:oligopeptide transport system ATP-binding protein
MPYTMGLLRSVPRLDWSAEGRTELEMIGGRVPDPARLPAGCSFHPRCRHALAGLCETAVPELLDAGDGHLVRCRRWNDIRAGA